MIRGQAAVFVQIERGTGAEIHVALIIPLDQLLVNSNRGRAGRQAEYRIRLEDDLRRNNVGRLTAHIVIVLCANDFHIQHLSNK